MVTRVVLKTPCMDPEPASVSKPSTFGEVISNSSHKGDLKGSDDDDPFSLSGPYIALLGLIIALATVGVPLTAVFTERPKERINIVPTALETDGSQSSISISLTRTGKSDSRNTSGKQE